MADLKKLALGRKAYAGAQKAAPKGSAKTMPPDKPEKPEKSLEASCKDEVGELETAFRDRLAKEDKRRAAATDAETWVCVYFRSREEKDRFLREHGLDRIGDKYLDGRAVDRVLKGRSELRVRDAHKDNRRG